MLLIAFMNSRCNEYSIQLAMFSIYEYLVQKKHALAICESNLLICGGKWKMILLLAFVGFMGALYSVSKAKNSIQKYSC